MKRFQIPLCIVLILVILSMGIPVFAENQTELTLTCKSAQLIDAATGQVLYSKNPDEKLPIASVTKTMTMLLVMEALHSGQIQLDELVTCSEYAASMGGSQVFLEPGEQMSVSDMLKAVAVASGNDAAVALGEHLYGSEQAAVAAMNERAKQLGCTNTQFQNCCGLDTDGHYSSAADVALISRALAQFPTIFEYTSIWMDSLRNGAFGLSNTNKLIRFYPGANGLKTGSTSLAQFCVSAAAKRGDMQLIAVVLGAPTSNDRNSDAKMLLDYGFATYSVEKIVTKGEELGEVRVEKGRQETVKAVSASDYTVLITKSKKEAITKEIILDESIVAPVTAGQKIGEVIVRAESKELQRLEIHAGEDVERIHFGNSFLDLLQYFGRK